MKKGEQACRELAGGKSATGVGDRYDFDGHGGKRQLEKRQILAQGWRGFPLPQPFSASKFPNVFNKVRMEQEFLSCWGRALPQQSKGVIWSEGFKKCPNGATASSPGLPLRLPWELVRKENSTATRLRRFLKEKCPKLTQPRCG